MPDPPFNASRSSRFRHAAAPLSRFSVREPGEYCHSREPPFLPEKPAGQFALLCAGPDSVNWHVEKPGSLLQGEDFVGHLWRVGDLHSTYGQLARNAQSVCKEFTDQGLFTSPCRIGQAVEGRCLVSRKPYE